MTALRHGDKLDFDNCDIPFVCSVFSD